MDRRTVLQKSSLALLSLPLLSHDANAFFPLLLRVAAGFAGRSLGRSAMQSAARGTARRAIGTTARSRASSGVQRRSNGYNQQMRNAYPDSDNMLAGDFVPYATEQIGAEFGDFLGSRYIDRWNESFEGGQEISGSGPALDNPDFEPSIGYVTGSSKFEVPTLFVSQCRSMSTLAESLVQQYNIPSPVLGGLLYPVEVLENDMVPDIWHQQRRSVYRTPFGQVAFNVYLESDGYLSNFEIYNSIRGDTLRVENVPARAI